MPVEKCARFSDELVECYALGRLTEPDCASFEEHFLLCEACQERLHAADEYVAAAKAAGAQLVRRKPSWAAVAGATLAATAVGICTLSLVLSGHSAPPTRATSRVSLASLRAGPDATIHHTLRARRLILDIDTSRLPEACDCRLQIVDHNGQPVWEQQVRVDGPAVEVEVDRVLAAGRYWLRLYGPGSSGDPWREYGFEIE